MESHMGEELKGGGGVVGSAIKGARPTVMLEGGGAPVRLQ